MRYALLLGLFTVGCTPDYLVLSEAETELNEEDPGTWDTAVLVINSPQSGAFVPWGEEASFDAVVVDAEGQELDFDEISWTSDADASWTIAGRSVNDDTLDVGSHAITARAELPNGDRLSHTVGGVLVQSAYAGTYSGTLRMDLVSDQITTACSGTAMLIIDPYGELVLGDASCFLSFQGVDIDGQYAIDAQNEDGSMEGEILLDISGFELPLGLDGDVSETGELQGSFTGDLMGFATVDGVLTATRITRDTSL